MAQKKITDLSLRSSFDETVNLPGDDTSQTWRVTGQQIKDFIAAQKTGSRQVENLALVTSVAASALTIAVKTKANANASSTDPINVGMRSSTLTSGLYNLRQISGALSMTLSSGSTLGQIDAKPAYIYVYLIDNAGTLELAVSHKYYPEDSLVSTTAEGGAGAADSATTMYSTSARSSVPCRLIGYILNTQTTAGTWASAGTQIQLLPSDNWKAPTMQKFTSGTSQTYYTPAGCKLIKIRCVGGGGGGGGGGTSGSGGTGGTGGNTVFGSEITASGGAGGTGNSYGGAGGAATVGAITTGTAIPGGYGGMGTFSVVSVGGAGAASAFGGQGQGDINNGGTAVAARANSGAGGGGGSTSLSGNGGGGGGAGGFCEALIADPVGSYTYSVGAAGTAGTAGTSGSAAAAGAAGYIEVTEYYQ